MPRTRRTESQLGRDTQYRAVFPTSPIGPRAKKGTRMMGARRTPSTEPKASGGPALPEKS
eukprot:9157396-Alexandrium_andersonii.AAC.1